MNRFAEYAARVGLLTQKYADQLVGRDTLCPSPPEHSLEPEPLPGAADEMFSRLRWRGQVRVAMRGMEGVKL